MSTAVTFDSFDWDELRDTELGRDYAAYRGWVYVTLKHFRDPEVLDLRGGESDAFDAVSRHIIARDESGEIIGCTRVIRNTPDLSLPALHHFPDCMNELDVNPWSVSEVSRFITTAKGQRDRRDIALLLIRELATFSLDRNRDRVVFVVEPPLRRWLSLLGVPLEPIGEERWIEEEQGRLTPFLVDLKECDRALAVAHQIYAHAGQTVMGEHRPGR